MLNEMCDQQEALLCCMYRRKGIESLKAVYKKLNVSLLFVIKTSSAVAIQE